MKTRVYGNCVRGLLWMGVVVVFIAGSLVVASCQQKQDMAATETEVEWEATQDPSQRGRDPEPAPQPVTDSTLAEAVTRAASVGGPTIEDRTGILAPERAEPFLPHQYTVASGDNLWAVSEQFYGTHVYSDLLAGWNGIEDPSWIEAGRTLEIPPISEFPHQLYLVREGDNLTSISRRFYDSGQYWEDLARANGLVNAHRVRAGMVLRIPHPASFARAASSDSTLLAAE